jgi:hypothetical protein
MNSKERSFFFVNLFYTVISFLALFQIAAASAQVDKGSFNAKCRLDKQDRYDFGPYMTKGPYAGQCMDTHSKRAAVILQDDLNTISFANFYHQGKFWTATLKKNAVTTAIFQIEQFAAPMGIRAAHTQLRFITRADSPLLLTPQFSSAAESKPVTVRSFIISFEYIAPKNVEFNIILGQFDQFNIVGRAVSFTSRSKEQVVDSGDTVRQYKLNLSAPNAAAIALNAIRRSNQEQFKFSYNTLDWDCTTEAFHIIDGSLKYTSPVPEFHVGYNPFDSIITPSLDALIQRGLIAVDDSSEIQTANSEIHRSH